MVEITGYVGESTLLGTMKYISVRCWKIIAVDPLIYHLITIFLGPPIFLLEIDVTTLFRSELLIADIISKGQRSDTLHTGKKNIFT